MALTITPDKGTPGRSGDTPMFSKSGRTLAVAPGVFALDNSYPNTGTLSTTGYPIDKTVAGSPYQQFGVALKFIDVAPVISPGANPAVKAIVQGVVDLVNKRLHVFVNGTEATNATDLSSMTGLSALPYKAYGYS